MSKQYGGRDGSSRSKQIQRWSAIIGGSTLAAIGLLRRGKSGIAVAAGGGLLAYAGATRATEPQQLTAESTILLNCSAEEAYRFWSDPLNLPLFMKRVDSVTPTGEGHYRWVALGPMGTEIVWETEITRVQENEFIEWRSLPGSDFQTEGRTEFQKATGDRGTTLHVTMQYHIPMGPAGRFINRYLGKVPSFWLRQDLRRLKALIETGEIPTIEGQSHGTRSAKIAALRLANPDQPVRRGTIKEEFSAQRRIA